MDRPVARTLRPLRLCLLGAAFAAAFAVIGFLAGGSTASASEADAEGAASQSSILSPVASLVAPVIERVAGPVEQRVGPTVDHLGGGMAEPVVAVIAAPQVLAAIAEPVVAVVAVPLVTDVVAPVSAIAQAPGLRQVSQAVVAPVEALADSALTPVRDVVTATRVGIRHPELEPVPGGVAPSTFSLGALPPAGHAAEAWTLSPTRGISAKSSSPSSAVSVRSGLPNDDQLLPGGYPSPVPFGDPADRPALPAAPAGQSGGGITGASGGGSQCPSDLPGALAPQILPGGEHVASGERTAPACPAFELGSTPD